MSIWLRFLLGLVARALGVLLDRYAEWRFRHLGDEDDDGGFVADLQAFGRWLMHRLSSRLTYQPKAAPAVAYADDWQAELFDR